MACGAGAAGAEVLDVALDAGVLAVFVLGGVVGSAATDIRPLLAATVSLVITGVFDVLRFVLFAAATSGESCAETTPATTKRRRVVRSMAEMIADGARSRTSGVAPARFGSRRS